MKLHCLGLGVVVLLAAHLQVDHVAGHYVGHEHHQVVHPRKGLPLGGNVCYGYPLKQGKFFSLSCHVLFYT